MEFIWMPLIGVGMLLGTYLVLFTIVAIVINAAKLFEGKPDKNADNNAISSFFSIYDDRGTK